MSDLHIRGCSCEECLPGFPAQATRVYQTPWRATFGEPQPRNRKRELFPQRYDNRPLWKRAIERRAA